MFLFVDYKLCQYSLVLLYIYMCDYDSYYDYLHIYILRDVYLQVVLFHFTCGTLVLSAFWIKSARGRPWRMMLLSTLHHRRTVSLAFKDRCSKKSGLAAGGCRWGHSSKHTGLAWSRTNLLATFRNLGIYGRLLHSCLAHVAKCYCWGLKPWMDKWDARGTDTLSYASDCYLATLSLSKESVPSQCSSFH